MSKIKSFEWSEFSTTSITISFRDCGLFISMQDNEDGDLCQIGIPDIEILRLMTLLSQKVFEYYDHHN